jgi:hypothetical protein
MAEKKTVRQTKPWIQEKVWLDFTPAAARKNLSTIQRQSIGLTNIYSVLKVTKPTQRMKG